MRGITVVLPFQGQTVFERARQALLATPPVRRMFVVHQGAARSAHPRCTLFEAPAIFDGRLWERIIGQVRTEFLLLVQEPEEIEWGPGALSRLADTAETTKAGMVYSDYGEVRAGRSREHPVNEYQPGSIRDDFHFGPVRLVSVAAARWALKRYGGVGDFSHAGLYDLRLKISADHALFHLQECLYTKTGDADASFAGHAGAGGKSRTASEEKHFAYVDSRHRAQQMEMEAAATAHLKRIGAWLRPVFREAPRSRMRFPLEASVIIPVKNRRRTVSHAVRSALSQQTDFAFNVICVDNHSTDGTTALLSAMARRHPALKHIIPRRTDLGIGGCWNEAIYSACCGRYAVQLDSDDLYSGPHTLQRIVERFRDTRCAMVIGAYTLVDEKLEEIHPGLVDHREWTDENGRNNALRINGLGAPRAFRTDLVRQIGFLNVSYGEDYAMVLRLLREHRLERIYDSLYFCRRWGGNTDADLPVPAANRNDAFKDKIRTLEIMARQAMNGV